MDNVVNLRPTKVEGTKELLEVLEEFQLDNILVLGEMEGTPILFSTFSPEKTNMLIDEVKIGLLLGDTEEP